MWRISLTDESLILETTLSSLKQKLITMIKTIKLIATKAVEEKMLKIYAIVMTSVFFAIWIPTMILVLKEIINQVIIPLLKWMNKKQ